jgi:hypothetical protein
MLICRRIYRLVLVCFAVLIALFSVWCINHAMAQGNLPRRYAILVIDQSFSVLRSGQHGQTHAQLVSDFLEGFGVECPDCWLGVIVFGEQVTTVVPLQSLDQWKDVNTDNLSSPQGLGPGTNFAAAIREAAGQLETQSGDNVERRIVLLTDTQLDNYTYRNQQQELETVIQGELIPMGIQLVVIDSAPGDLEEPWWDRELINLTGGWYMKGDEIGAAETTLQTLLWAFDKPPDAITLRGGSIRYRFTVAPYRRQVQMRLTYSGEISATVSAPAGQANVRKGRRDGQINLTIDDPVEGEWSVTVGGTGTFKLFLPPIQVPRRIGLALHSQSQQRLPVSTPVRAELILRDIDQTTVISDTRFQVSAYLVDDGGLSQGNLNVSFDPSCGCYIAARQDVTGLEGQYYIHAEVTATWLLEPLVLASPGSIVWGRVPQFADIPRVSLARLPKVEFPFSMTVGLENMDTVSDVVVQFRAIGPGGTQPFAPSWVQCEENCSFEIPPLLAGGDYTFIARLCEGHTALEVLYSPPDQPHEVSAQVYVRPLNLWEQLVKHWWVVLLLAVGIGVALYFFGYSIIVVLTNDVDSMARRLR